MRIIAFIDEADTVKKIHDHIGESSQPPRIEQAKIDWREGRFPKVPGDEDAFIALPG